MAPKPIPTKLKILRGNPSGRPLNLSEPEPKAGKPRMPDHVRLDDEARREWKRITDTLDEMHLLTTADRAALAAYCVCWSRWVDAENKLRQFGVVIKSPNDYLTQSPYLVIARDSMAQMTKLLTEFGLTPSSRTRLSTHLKDEGGSLFEQWEQSSRKQAR